VLKSTEAVGATTAATGATWLSAIGMAVDKPANGVPRFRFGGRLAAATDEASAVVRIA